MTTTFTFDGTTCTITTSTVLAGTAQGYDVRIVEGNDLDKSAGMAIDITLETVDGGDLTKNFSHWTNLMSRPTQWAKNRVVFVAALAARRIATMERDAVAPGGAWSFPVDEAA